MSLRPAWLRSRQPPEPQRLAPTRITLIVLLPLTMSLLAGAFNDAITAVNRYVLQSMTGAVVTAHTDEAAGTTFTIELPVVPADTRSETAQAPGRALLTETSRSV
jgi:hypothetical protein